MPLAMANDRLPLSKFAPYTKSCLVTPYSEGDLAMARDYGLTLRASSAPLYPKPDRPRGAGHSHQTEAHPPRRPVNLVVAHGLAQGAIVLGAIASTSRWLTRDLCKARWAKSTKIRLEQVIALGEESD